MLREIPLTIKDVKEIADTDDVCAGKLSRLRVADDRRLKPFYREHQRDGLFAA